MKPLYFLLFLLALTLGCKHEPLVHEFAVVCDFPRFSFSNLVLITNEAGDVVQEIPVAPGASGINARFSMPTSDPEATFGVHMIEDYFSENHRFVHVYSHCGLRNGSPVKLGAETSIGQQLPMIRALEIKIKGIFSINYIQFAGQSMVIDYRWNTKTAICAVDVPDNSALYLRVKANSEVRQILIPNISLQPSIELNWSDFTPENAQNIHVSMPILGGFPGSFLCASYAVSPDFQQALPLFLEDYIHPDSMLHFRVPAGLPIDWKIYVTAQDQDCHIEKTFRLDESITLTPLLLSIYEHQREADSDFLTLKCIGPADLLRAQYRLLSYDDRLSFTWQIDASRDRFKRLPIPKITQYLALPSSIKFTDLFTTITATAFYSGQFDYPDVARGFPWRSTEPFALARGGYEMIQK